MFQHGKRIRLFAATLTVVVALTCIWWLYDTEYHYANTPAGRLAAVKDYMRDSDRQRTVGEINGKTPLRAIASQTEKKWLFIFYGAENKDNVHGIIHLTRGLNGKYRPVNATASPFPYTAGIYTKSLQVKGTNWSPIVIAGDNCAGIDSIRVEYAFTEVGSSHTGKLEKTYPISNKNFLWLLDREQLQKDLSLENKELEELRINQVSFLDQNGNDVTDQYRDSQINQNWSGGKGTAEAGMLYVFIGMVAILAILLVRYLLRKDG